MGITGNCQNHSKENKQLGSLFVRKYHVPWKTLRVLQLGVPSSWITMKTASTLRCYHLGYKIKRQFGIGTGRLSHWK